MIHNKNGLLASNSIADIQSWLRLIREKAWSRKQKHVLLDFFKIPQLIYQASINERDEVVGRRLKSPDLMDAKVKQLLCDDLFWLERCDEQLDHHLIRYIDDDYPPMLREISDPPIALFAIGNRALLDEPKIAMVGSRRPSPVGKQFSQTLAAQLAQSGLCVTSGMALGIDGCSHQGALDVNGSTIAVLGCGLDVIYPARHRQLYYQIAQKGLLLSEYPLATPASKITFPQRNRIVSGLCYGVIIVEAAHRSGTLITARLAMEQNREVFVVPGPVVSPQYYGSHQLLRQGANLITKAEHVIADLALPLTNLLQQTRNQIESADNSRNAIANEVKQQDGDSPIESKPINSLNTEEQKLLESIGYEASSVEQIILTSGLTAGQVCSMLLLLEVQGCVGKTDTGDYIRLI